MSFNHFHPEDLEYNLLVYLKSHLEKKEDSTLQAITKYFVKFDPTILHPYQSEHAKQAIVLQIESEISAALIAMETSYFIRSYVHEIFFDVIENGIHKSSETRRVTYYGILPKGNAILKKCELYGRMTRFDWDSINQSLKFFEPWGANSMLVIAEIMKELGYTYDIGKYCKVLIRYGFAEPTEIKNVIRLTERGRELMRVGSIQKFEELIDAEEAEKRNASEFNKEMRRRNDIEFKRNTVVFVVGIFVAMAAILQGTLNLLDIRKHHPVFYEHQFLMMVIAIVPTVLAIIAWRIWDESKRT